jgi:hypothetical protein
VSWYWSSITRPSAELIDRASLQRAIHESLGLRNRLIERVQARPLVVSGSGAALPVALVPLEAAVRTHGRLASLRLLVGYRMSRIACSGAQPARAVENVLLYLAEGRSARPDAGEWPS